MYKMTKHAQVDRYDRICGIIDSIGLGEPRLKIPHDEYPNRDYVLTTTGVLLIVSEDTYLITAYVPTVAKVYAIFRTAMAHGRMPNDLYNAIVRNDKVRHKHPEWV